MRFCIFGRTVTSSWGNGHATLWRGLIRALVRDGHQVVFFERDVPYYARHRDLRELPGCEIVLYPDWSSVEAKARRELERSDVGMVTSYCADGVAATERVLSSGVPLRAFYDLDTPVTLDRLARGLPVPYLSEEGLGGFDLVLSYTGGPALHALREQLGARRVAALYGSVDPEAHHPVEPVDDFRCDFSYLGTFAPDRQQALEHLFLQPARVRSDRRFIIAGPQYPADFRWSDNLWYREHVPPAEHPAFFSSSRLTLNVTREAVAQMGWCPSVRMLEAMACGAAVVTDDWPCLEHFFTPGEDVLVADDGVDVIGALSLTDVELERIRAAARERVLSQHTSQHRARELVAMLQSGRSLFLVGADATGS